jgi:hypothetical protein
VPEPQELLPRQVVGHVLATHPEAQSLLAEAGHCRALADQSAAEVTRTFPVMQVARLGYEELRHRLDPRRRRTIHFGVAMTLMVAIAAALTVLDDIEFAGVLTGWLTAAAAVVTAAAWTGCAWLAALAGREKRSGLLAAITGGVTVFGLLLAALHGNGRFPGAADPRYRFGVGILLMLLILGLVAVAAALIARTEPASLLVARRRWHRARSGYEAAVSTQRSDAEAAVVAAQGWGSLIQAQADSAPAARSE